MRVCGTRSSFCAVLSVGTGGNGEKNEEDCVMSLRLELSDLPLRYRAQVEQKITKNGKKRNDPVLSTVPRR